MKRYNLIFGKEIIAIFMKINRLLFTLLVLTTFLVSFSSIAQTTQSVIGQVRDADSKEPLMGVAVSIQLTNGTNLGSITDDVGFFEIQNVPIGRHALKVELVGYEVAILQNIIVISGKQSNIQVTLVEKSTTLKEAVVRSKEKSESNNDMVTVSSRSFDAEEAERYAGSRQDPARMAQSFAGVQGTDDQRNDIVVRGNSPLGLVWRYEGVDIFNPNHFAIAGTTGGPISMINNKVIGNSDFLTGAFPAEYGNGVAGFFDMNMRNGNYNKAEYSGQFGLWGTELMAEGPINKEKKSSYLINYRYATFSIFQALGIDLGTDATPEYQDGAFRLNFPSKKGGFSIFGMGGLSSIDIVFSDDEEPTEELYGLKDRDQYFRTNMGIIGMNWRRYLKKNTSIKTTLAYNAQKVSTDHYKIFRNPMEYTDLRLTPVLHYDMLQSKTTLHSVLNKKFSARSALKAGVILDAFDINFKDSTRNENALTETWVELLDSDDKPLMFRTYASWKYRLTEKLTMQSGLHFLYTQMGDQVSVEPRLGFTYKPNKNEQLALAYGNHSQVQPTYTYYAQFIDSASQTLKEHNVDMGLTRSHHLVASYQRKMKHNFNLRTEVYYQSLYNVPVEVIPSSFSLLNQGSGFVRFFPDVLENTGTGTNYGMELTLEKFFGNQFYILTTASLYDSKYTGSDGIERNTDFNGNYIVNALGGIEIPTGKNGKNNINLGTKLTWGGGKRHSPIDSARTIADGAKVVFVDSERNSLQLDDYFRWDLKIAYKINGKSATHEISLDLINFLDVQNVLAVTYVDDPEVPGSKKFVEQYQLGFLPSFYYKIEF